MGKFSYLILNFLFFSPIVIFLWIKFRNPIKKYKKLITYAGFLGVLYFFIVDPVAVSWQAWSYDENLNLGIKFWGTLLEELIWSILVFMIVSVVVCILVDAVENKQKFRSLTKSK